MKNKRIYNFGAGPATLPKDIVLEVQQELLDWQGLGLSILEIGHRTPEFMALMASMEADLRSLLTISDDYQVLFFSAPARAHFSMIPFNILESNQQAAYAVSGIWSAMAFEEAARLGPAYCAARAPEPFRKTPDKLLDWDLKKDTAYVYYTPNETVNGVQFSYTPDVGTIPLVADMTSCLLSEPINVSDFGLIFAGAQKNIAPAGLSIVIIRNSLLDRKPVSPLATMLDYRVAAKHHSLYATPPVFNCYVAAKMFSWIKRQGGVSALHAINCQKAAKLYAYIDSSAHFNCPIEPSSRSIMNVCFSLNNALLNDTFVEKAREAGLYALKGHRLVGGLRASLYNAMPMAGVDALLAFMQQFEETLC